MGCLGIFLVTCLTIVTMLASFYYIFAFNFLIGGILFAVSIALFVYASKMFRNWSDRQDLEFFRKYPDVSFLRIAHPHTEARIEFEYLEGPHVNEEMQFFNTSALYFTHGVISGTHTANVTYKPSGTGLPIDLLANNDISHTLTFELKKDKFYQISFDKGLQEFHIYETQIPKDFNRIIKLKNSIKRVNF